MHVNKPLNVEITRVVALHTQRVFPRNSAHWLPNKRTATNMKAGKPVLSHKYANVRGLAWPPECHSKRRSNMLTGGNHTHPVAGALEIVVVGGALGLVDVRIDADARLVDAHQIVAARGALAHQAVARKVRRRRLGAARCSAGCEECRCWVEGGWMRHTRTTECVCVVYVFVCEWHVFGG